MFSFCPGAAASVGGFFFFSLFFFSFFFYNVTAPSLEKRLPMQEKKRGKNSASKQIRPEPLKRSGCVQDPFSLRVNQMMRRRAQICITSVLVPFCARGPCARPKNRGCIQKYPHHVFCFFVVSCKDLTPKLCVMLLSSPFLLIICCFVLRTCAPIFFSC